MLCDEERSTVQGLIGFIENTSERLENMRGVGSNVKDYIHACSSTLQFAALRGICRIRTSKILQVFIGRCEKSDR